MVIKSSSRGLGLRRSVIIVSAGNPSGIASIEDLCKEGVGMGIAARDA